MNRTILLVICCALLSAFGFAQMPPGCSPAGTWYGGSDVKYLVTVTPVTGERFTIRADPAFDIPDLGYKAFTSWSGQLVRLSANRYVGQYISLYSTSSDVPPPPESMEMDGVRGYVSFTGCDNMRIAYDRYLIYFDLNKIVFVDPPDVDIDITGLVETYQRMPMNCPACSLPAAPSTHLPRKR